MSIHANEDYWDCFTNTENDDENTEWTNDESKNSAATILEQYLENNMRLNHNLLYYHILSFFEHQN